MNNSELLDLIFPQQRPSIKMSVISHTFDPRKSDAGMIARLSYRSFYARPLFIVDGKAIRVREWSTEYDANTNTFTLVLDGRRYPLSELKMSRRPSGRVVTDCISTP